MQSYDLNLLTALEALLATGSVTAAAERMHLSTPAMSHTLARIREAFGDPILVRAGRKLVPTPRALELVEPVGRIVAQAYALRAVAGSPRLEELQRHFVVRAPDGMTVVFGAPLAIALAQRMPRASVQFLPEAHSDVGALREGRIDIDVGSFRDKDPEVQTVVLSEQRLMGLVREGHPLLASRITAKRFAAERHVAVASRPGEASPVDIGLKGLGLQRFVALTVPNAYAAAVIAARSPLVACVPERTAHAMKGGLKLAAFELPLAVVTDPMLMAWHPRHGADAAHMAFRDLLRQVLTDPNWLAPPAASVQRAAAGSRKGDARRATRR